MPHTASHPTPAELKARRLALGLPRAVLGGMIGRTADDVRTSEHPRAERPLPGQDATLTELAREVTAFVDGVIRAKLGSVMTYESDDDFGRMDPAVFRRLRHTGVHLVALAFARDILREDGRSLTLVAYDPEQYDEWLASRGERDGAAARLRWCEERSRVARPDVGANATTGGFVQAEVTSERLNPGPSARRH